MPRAIKLSHTTAIIDATGNNTCAWIKAMEIANSNSGKPIMPSAYCHARDGKKTKSALPHTPTHRVTKFKLREDAALQAAAVDLQVKGG